ncbi:hypothetical protein EW146_g4403 [Bondarzewia mesenterica]|uniref:Uncharacterized protein n=1 Tax=Bondarzewia mesenterica TaxID=1095465 RepID=A0A4S4LUP4_9AGAM|nr:hypothetical protein EW146_g4403 [Bondarzewia mesenterica]
MRISPNKVRLVEKPSIVSASSYQFGEERMIRARRGLLKTQSLEKSVLMGEREDLLFRPEPVFTRPVPVTRPHSSTSSFGSATPPLSISDGSSQSSGSQSSIDLSQLNAILSNVAFPMTGLARNHIRTRARGQGHRRRISQTMASRSSVYETIEEESTSAQNSPTPTRFLPPSEGTVFSPVANRVRIVDADETHSGDWDDDRGVGALRKYFALRDEAHVTVEESKRIWLDTPFSLFALQSFEPPAHPTGMQAMLEHSKQTYIPLSSALRPRRRTRSRTHSRPSPYPRAAERSPIRHRSPAAVAPLQDRTVNSNISMIQVLPFDPEKEVNLKNFGLPARPRVGSNARRTALGWSKRSTGRGSKENRNKENKENKENTSYGSIATPSESLRLSRPRPKGRPNSHALPQSVRV